MILTSETNMGYAGGHQISLQQAQNDNADLLWILNNDTRVPPDTLTHLVTAYNTYGDGLYGGVPIGIRSTDMRRVVLMHYKYLNPHYREIIFDRNSFQIYETLFPEPNQVLRIAAISGSCFLLPLSIVREYGFMDTDYFLYSEEIDYCFRLRQADVPIWIVPKAVIEHEGEGSSSGFSVILSDIVQYYRIRNQLVRIKRYGTLWDTVRAMIKNAVLTTLQLVQGRFRRVGFMIRGMWDGMEGRLGKTIPPENYI
jgi:GT2 family glycosyltransferase